MKRLLVTVVAILVCLIGSLLIFNSNKNKSNLKTIKVAEVAHSIFYAPMYVAKNEGFFEDENINLEIILTPGADKVAASVLSGDAHIGFSGSEACIYVYKGKTSDYLKTFAQLTQKDGSFIVSRKKIDNFKLEDLKGSTIIGGRQGVLLSNL